MDKRELQNLIKTKLDNTRLTNEVLTRVAKLLNILDDDCEVKKDRRTNPRRVRATNVHTSEVQEFKSIYSEAKNLPSYPTSVANSNGRILQKNFGKLNFSIIYFLEKYSCPWGGVKQFF